MENKCYVGIDVGTKGFIASTNGYARDFFSLEDHDMKEAYEYLSKLQDFYKSNMVCVIEDVHAIYGSSAKGTFSFGFQKGYLIGLLTACKIPYVLVQPKEWQKEMWGNSDIVVKYKEVTIKGKKTIRKEINTKETSINTAKRLFPCIDFRKTERCKKIDDNKVDATLMSEYARRKNL